MFRKVCIAAFCFTLAVTWWSVPSAAREVCPDPLIQGWEPWPPYQIARSGEPTGVDIEIVNAIADRMGCSVAYRKMPWSRLLESISAGEADFAVQANYTADRASFAYYSDPYLPYQTRLIVESGERTDYPNLAAFLSEGNTIGIVQGYDYGNDANALLDRDRYADQIVEGYSVGAHVKPLVRGRIDGVIAERFVFAHEAGKADVRDDIAITDLTVTSVQTYAIFSRASVSRATVEAFNTAMAKVKENGTFDAIVQRYLK